jgi:hypothetical protein
MTTENPASPRRGCFFYGCLTGVVCLVAILLALLLGLHQFRKMVNWYTDSKPLELPPATLSPQQFQQVQDRMDRFQDAIRGGRHAEPLALTAEEINALITQDPRFQMAKDKLRVVIQQDQLQARVSVPMEELGLGMFKGRYLNGEGELALSLDNGILRITPQTLRVKGRPLPTIYMDRIRVQNLAEPLNQNPRSSVALNRLAAIEVKNGQLVLVPKHEQ